MKKQDLNEPKLTAAALENSLKNFVHKKNDERKHENHATASFSDLNPGILARETPEIKGVYAAVALLLSAQFNLEKLLNSSEPNSLLKDQLKSISDKIQAAVPLVENGVGAIRGAILGPNHRSEGNNQLINEPLNTATLTPSEEKGLSRTADAPNSLLLSSLGFTSNINRTSKESGKGFTYGPSGS